MISPIVSIQHVSKFYANHTALNDISLEIPQGTIYGLLGPNGAGKTSLIRIINQITGADLGSVYYKNQLIGPEHISKIGYLPEERGLYKKMEVGEQLLYLGQLKGLSRSQVLERAKKWMIKFEIENWWGKKLEELSKGMQQKVQFISTILHEPELIILDEPFTGFDPINANLIKDEILALKNNGATIIFSTHRMESVEQMCDNIALINHSQKMLDGKLSDIIDDYKENIYEVEYIADNELKDIGYEIVESGSKDRFKMAKIRLAKEVSPNKLLSDLISKVEVHIFKEILPTVNDIFIKIVQK
ncbi:MAG: ABC transporter ATP-binding protein [Bacteroidetes bacterium]|nr:ABC transporter ATP-binding protein [Bacteroidota bacterium]